MQSLPDSLRSYYSWRSPAVKGNQRPPFLYVTGNKQGIELPPDKILRLCWYCEGLARRFCRARR